MRQTLWVGTLAVTLALFAGAAGAQETWTFDCGLEGVISTDEAVMNWENGELVQTYADTGAFDPVMQFGGLSIDGSALQEVAISFTIENASNPVPAAFFFFDDADPANASQIPLDSYDNGSHLVRFNAATEPLGTPSAVDWATSTITGIRFDFPDDAGATFADYENTSVRVDWIAVSNDPAFTPTQDTQDCSEPPISNPVTATQVQTPPTIDGVIGADEYGSFTPPVAIDLNTGYVTTWGATTTPDPSNISYTIQAAWDSTALYVALDVTDDVVDAADQTGEYIQVVLTPEDATGNASGSLSDIWLLPDGSINWTNNPGGGGVDWGAANITGAWTTTANGYALELRYPWSDFNITLPTIEVGAQLRALFSIADRDDSANSDVTAFLLASGAEGINPFENHDQVSKLILGAGGDPADEPDADWDGDTLTNGEELSLGTDPQDADTDGDGLSDGAEVNTHNTDPLDADTDGDGATDGQEVQFGSDPLNAASTVTLPLGAAAGLAGLLLAGAGAVALRRRAKA
jgi:hypothetical protein